PGERVVVGVDANPLVADTHHEPLAPGPADDLGVAQRAARHQERYVGVGIGGQVHAYRQALDRVPVVTRTADRARGEPEARRERRYRAPELVGIGGEQRQEDGVWEARAVR